MFWPNERIKRQTRFVATTGGLVTFVVASFFGIFGVEIEYALIIGILSGFVAVFFAFRVYGPNT